MAERERAGGSVCGDSDKLAVAVGVAHRGVGQGAVKEASLRVSFVTVPRMAAGG